VGALGTGAQNIVDGANAEKLIPDLNERLKHAQRNAEKGA
jgi:hypothetical protein